jgi:hypothetical protein
MDEESSGQDRGVHLLEVNWLRTPPLLEDRWGSREVVSPRVLYDAAYLGFHFGTRLNWSCSWIGGSPTRLMTECA